MKTALLLSVLCAAMAVTASQSCGTCANDEFCNNTTNTCQCNSTLYTYTADNPSPNVTCTGGNFTILVSKCWLEANGFNATNVTLRSDSCVAQREVVNGTAEMGIHRPLVTNDCGTTTTTNDTHVIYNNTLYIYSKRVPIQLRRDVFMNISCAYPLTINNVSLNFSLNPLTGSTEISVPGSSATFTVNMVAYTNPAFSNPLSASDVLYVEDIIYISVEIPGLNGDSFSVQVVRIYATGDGTDATQYNLLADGCPATGDAAGLLSPLMNGNSTESRFTMKVFQITGAVNIRLFADVLVCTSKCVPVCTSQGKSGKSSDSEGSTATVSIIYQPSERFDVTSSASSFSMSQTLPALLFSWILVKLM